MGVDRSRLPDIGPDPLFTLPAIVRHQLDNGLQLRTVEHHSVPVVTFSLIVDSGSGADPARQEGLAALTADMVDEGTGLLSAIDVSDVMARIGAQYDADVGADATTFTLTTLTRFASRAATLLADLVTAPSLRAHDFTRVRQLRLDRLRQLTDVPPTVAERAFLELLYGAHPYGHLSIGSESALRGFTLDDVDAFHAREYRPSRCTLVMVGAMSHDQLRGLAAESFGGWTESGDGRSGIGDRGSGMRDQGFEISDQGLGISIVPREGAAQSEIRIGHLVTGRNTPDYPALLVMNSVLGGQFVSRVNLKLREEKGYTYGARTGFDWRRGRSPFALAAAVHTAATADAISDSMAELSAIRGPRPPSNAELTLAKASLTRGYARNFETAQQVARSVSQLVVYDLPETYFEEFVPKTNGVTVADVVEAAARHLDPAWLTTLVVGDHQAVGESLRTLGEIRVIPNP